VTADTSTGATDAGDAADPNLAITCAQIDGGDGPYEARLRDATAAVRRAAARHDPGTPADLLIVTDDPFAHPSALRDVWGVIRHGHPVATTSPFAPMGAYGAAVPTAAGGRWTT